MLACKTADDGDDDPNDDDDDCDGGDSGGGGTGSDGVCVVTGDEYYAESAGCVPESTPVVVVVYVDPCPGIAQAIWNTITGVGMPGDKSLLTRVVEQIRGQSGQVFNTHQVEINGIRNRLKNLGRSWKNNDCDPPDDPPYGTNDWIKQTTAPNLRYWNAQYHQYVDDIAQLAAGTGGAALAAQAADILASITAFLESLGASAAAVPVLL
jgi:hypothetical protein